MATSIAERHTDFMREAFDLARRGLGKTSPNPMVGCVLVNGGRVVGRGWHERFGARHAEPGAIEQAGAKARGAVAYVTLEPCCYHGKQPPCTDALIRAGVKKVIYASGDPNPLIAGKGARALRRAGIAVESGLMREEGEDLNRPFFKYILTKRPYVFLKAAASLDGKVATRTGESKWITSSAARERGHELRARVDAILVGIGTVLADDPALTARGKGPDPVRVVLDTRLRFPKSARMLKQPGRTLILTGRDSFGDPKRFGRADVQVVSAPVKGGRLDPAGVLELLGRMGLSSVLVEGGAAVQAAFLEAKLVDEVRLFLAPKLIGGKDAKSFFDGPGFASLRESLEFDDLSFEPVGKDLMVVARRRAGGAARKKPRSGEARKA